jgi:hypothetical protein
MRMVGLVFCFILLSISSWAQSTYNPFDLVPRLDQGDTLQGQTERIPIFESDNPFDIIAPAKEEATGNTPILPTPSEESVKPGEDATAVIPPEESQFRQFLFALLIFLLVLLTLLVTFFRSFISKVYRAFLNENLLNQLHREQGPIVDLPYLFFYLLFFLSGGLFLFLLADFYEWPLNGSHFQKYMMLSGGLLALFLGKHLLLKIIEVVFPVEKEISAYSFTIVVFSIILGLALLPVDLILAYGPEEGRKLAVWGASYSLHFCTFSVLFEGC